MPCLTTLAHSCSAVVLPIWTMSSPKELQKQSHSCSCQGCKATNHIETLLNLAKHWNSPEPSGTFRKLPPEPTPAHTGTLRNVPEVASGTYMEPSGIFRKLPPEPTPAHAGTLRNLPPEPSSGTFLRNLPPEPSSGTFLRNLPPEPSSGTFLRNLPPEPSSGTFLRNLPPEPALQTRSGTHRSLSGLKTPLAYAVGEKNKYFLFLINIIDYYIIIN